MGEWRDMKLTKEEKQELADLVTQDRVLKQDKENLEKAEYYINQLRRIGLRVHSSKIGYDGWFDGTHCIFCVVEDKNGELFKVRLSSGDKDPHWFFEYKHGGASPLSLVRKDLFAEAV